MEIVHYLSKSKDVLVQGLPGGEPFSIYSLKWTLGNVWAGGSACSIAFIQQHMVTLTPRLAEEILLTCLIPLVARTLPEITSVDILVSSKLRIFYGGTEQKPRKKTSFKFSKTSSQNIG